jgi:hypothetical protein
MPDQDLTRIVEAAIEAQETGLSPSAETIAAIADGDEDIPKIITNMARLRWLFWTTPEQGLKFLQIERELDEEDLGDAEEEACP